MVQTCLVKTMPSALGCNQSANSDLARHAQALGEQIPEAIIRVLEDPFVPSVPLQGSFTKRLHRLVLDETTCPSCQGRLAIVTATSSHSGGVEAVTLEEGVGGTINDVV